MKYFIINKRCICLVCVISLVLGVFGLPMRIQAETVVLVREIQHQHMAGCMGTVYRTIQAEKKSGPHIIEQKDCSLCDGYVHYYDYSAQCSCGLTWYDTGHACSNSIYGTNQGSCTKYEEVRLNTYHEHPFREYVCGMTEDTVIGNIKVQSSTVLPAKEVFLTAEAEGEWNDIELIWQNGDGTEQLKVNKNGTYYLYAKYSDNGIEYMEEIQVVISNIDNDLPDVSEIMADRTEYTSEGIVLSVEAEDEYGLPETYISWNGGKYGKDTRYEVKENGIYKVTIRDIAGNTVTKTIEINNIDMSPPEITDVILNPMPWYEGNCRITVEAVDIGDGNNGSGLATEAYSWDGGLTWSENNYIEQTESGILEIAVRDDVGNIASRAVEIIKEELPEEETESVPEESEKEPEEGPEEETKSESTEEPESEEETDTIPEAEAEPESEAEPDVKPEEPETKEETGSEPVEEPDSEPDKKEEKEETGSERVSSAPEEEPCSQPEIIEIAEEADVPEPEQENAETSQKTDSGEYEQETLKYIFLPEPEREQIRIDTTDFYNLHEALQIKLLIKDTQRITNQKRIVGAGIVLVSMGSLALIIGLWCGMCDIYEVSSGGYENYLGRTGIRYGRICSLKIKDSIIDLACERTLKIRVPRIFVKANKDRPIKIIVASEVIDKYIENEITLHIHA